MYFSLWPEIIGTLWISGKLAWYDGMPWQPMHIATLFAPAWALPPACCANVADTVPARASAINRERFIVRGVRVGGCALPHRAAADC